MVNLDRRSLFAAGLAASLAHGAAPEMTTAAAAGERPRSRTPAAGPGKLATIESAAIGSAGVSDRTEVLQRLIDTAALDGTPITLPPGRFPTRGLTLRQGTRISGAGPATRLELIGGGALLTATSAADIALSDLAVDGGHLPSDGGLVRLSGCRNVELSRLDVVASGGHGIELERASGRIEGCRISYTGEAAIRAIDSLGLAIVANVIRDCGNNGILVWRSQPGEDGTLVQSNRISGIRALRGGSGEHGNGINVFRAGNVILWGNRIADCAYSAVRANAASNVQIVSNSISRCGEVAVYAEFGFEGALIAQNLIDGAATGISVTNFDHGGRLAVVEGNVVRNLFRREHEPIDKRGDGITVEADATVTGNTIEGAPSAGIVIGWGRHLRDCIASGNLIRNAGIGILISDHADGGTCVVSGNLVSGARSGAIRLADHGVAKGPDLARDAPRNPRLAVSSNTVVA